MINKKSRFIQFPISRPLCAALIFVPVWNWIVYNGSRYITTGFVHHCLETAYDRLIPFLPWTVSIYFTCYAFWIANYVLACRRDSKRAWVFLSAEFLAKCVCLLFFFILPTANTRPEIGKSDIWDSLMRFLYTRDAADNLFPSIHCLSSWFSFIEVRGDKSVPSAYRAFSLLFALAVCLSTLTTKQHVIVDVFAGVGLAELSFHFSEKSGFYRLYSRVFCSRRLKQGVGT